MNAPEAPALPGGSTEATWAQELLPDGALIESTKTPSLARRHAPRGTGGTNYVTASKPGNHGQYPAYFQNVRNAMMRGGKTIAEASKATWGALRRWRRGGGGVSPEVQKAAAAALAELEAIGAKAKAKAAAVALREAAHERAADYLDRLREGGDPDQERWPAGTPGGLGGQWKDEHGKLTPRGRKRSRDMATKWQAKGMRPATKKDLERLKRDEGITMTGYENVHVAVDPGAGLAVRALSSSTGADKREYTKAHKEAKAAEKFDRVSELHRIIPRLDEHLDRLARTDDSAAILRLIRATGLRPGSGRKRSAKEESPDTYGATNLEGRHVEPQEDGSVVLNFTGKSGKGLRIQVEDRAVARDLARRAAAGGPDAQLFSGNESAALKTLDRLAPGFVVKDLRTYRATVTALQMAVDVDPPPTTLKAAQAERRRIAKAVSEILGNTPKMALDSYIDPDVWDAVDWPLGDL